MPGISSSRIAARAPLVLGIGVGVEEGERDALDVQRAQSGTSARTAASSSGSRTAPCASMRSGTVKRSSRGTNGLGLSIEIVLIEAALVADIEHVAEALGRDQRRLGAAALDDGVGRKRRAVNEDVDIAHVGTRVGENETHAVQHRLLRPLRRRQHLARLAILAHVQHDVGERAADINGKPHLGSLKHSKSPC